MTRRPRALVAVLLALVLGLSPGCSFFYGLHEGGPTPYSGLRLGLEAVYWSGDAPFFDVWQDVLTTRGGPYHAHPFVFVWAGDLLLTSVLDTAILPITLTAWLLTDDPVEPSPEPDRPVRTPRWVY